MTAEGSATEGNGFSGPLADQTQGSVVLELPSRAHSEVGGLTRMVGD
jgi:hypothetical protein